MIMVERTNERDAERRGWAVIYYKAASGDQPVKSFIEAQPGKVQAMIRKGFRLLRERNVSLGMPHVRKMAGRDFWELRTRFSGDIYRTFYFAYAGRKFILLHAFQKKSEKTPTKELEIAEARMEDYLQRAKQDQKRGGNERTRA